MANATTLFLVLSCSLFEVFYLIIYFQLTSAQVAVLSMKLNQTRRRMDKKLMPFDFRFLKSF